MSMTTQRPSASLLTEGQASPDPADVSLGDLPLMLTVEEAARVLRVGRNGAYAAVADGVLPAVRIGRTIRIPRAALAEMLGVSPPERP